MEMRRKDREITSVEEKLEVIKECMVCRLGMVTEGYPYIVPMNYGYSYEDEQLVLYFHSANEGKKLDILKNNSTICFELDCEHQLVEGNIACEYGYKYASVIGFGTVEFLDTKEQKIKALNYLMKQQTKKDSNHEFSDAHLQAVTVFQVLVSSYTGKRKV